MKLGKLAYNKFIAFFFKCFWSVYVKVIARGYYCLFIFALDNLFSVVYVTLCTFISQLEFHHGPWTNAKQLN